MSSPDLSCRAHHVQCRVTERRGLWGKKCKKGKTKRSPLLTYSTHLVIFLCETKGWPNSKYILIYLISDIRYIWWGKNAIWSCIWKWAKSLRNETKMRLNYLSWKAHPPKQLKSPLTGFWLCMNGTTSPFAWGIHLMSELWAVKPRCFTPPLPGLVTGQLLLHNTVYLSAAWHWISYEIFLISKQKLVNL